MLGYALQKKRAEFWDTQPHYGGDRGALHCFAYPGILVQGKADA